MALRILRRGLIASSYLKVIPRTSKQEVANGHHASCFWVVSACVEGKKIQGDVGISEKSGYNICRND